MTNVQHCSRAVTTPACLKKAYIWVCVRPAAVELLALIALVIELYALDALL